MTGFSGGVRRGPAGWTVLALAALWSLACARQAPPPGGPPDARPPVIVSTVPEPFADVPDFEGPIRFEFDERISEQAGSGRLEDVVTLSPRSGLMRVRHGGGSLSVEIEGGFRPGVVYRVTLLPGVRDLFGNTATEPFELVFSTGADAAPTTVAGEVWDRVTGQGLPEIELHAVGPDSLVHLAVAGDGGIYAFRYLPAGRYELTAFEDTNLDGDPGATEPKGTDSFSVAAGDTLFLDVPVLQPDSTPALVIAAEALDSVTVAVRFDDFLDPATSADSVAVTLVDSLGAEVPVAEVFHEMAYMEYVQEVRDSLAREDSVARANAPPEAVVDTAAVAPGELPADSADVTSAATATTPRGPPALTGTANPGVAAARARGRILPGRRWVALLARPLASGVPVTIRASGVVNLNGLDGGGGEAEVVWIRPETEPDSLPGLDPGVGGGGR